MFKLLYFLIKILKNLRDIFDFVKLYIYLLKRYRYVYLSLCIFICRLIKMKKIYFIRFFFLLRK